MTRVSTPLAERLRANSQALENGCIEWIGCRQKFGYGYMTTGSRTNGTNRLMLTHRVAWLVAYGDLPDDLKVLHTCDNPSCINVDHLFLGTQVDNIKDMIKKGRKRVAKGYAHADQKISHDQANEIRTLYATGDYTQTTLATMYHVAQGQISLIVLHKHWTDR